MCLVKLKYDLPTLLDNQSFLITVAAVNEVVTVLVTASVVFVQCLEGDGRLEVHKR